MSLYVFISVLDWDLELKVLARCLNQFEVKVAFACSRKNIIIIFDSNHHQVIIKLSSYYIQIIIVIIDLVVGSLDEMVAMAP